MPVDCTMESMGGGTVTPDAVALAVLPLFASIVLPTGYLSGKAHLGDPAQICLTPKL